MPKPRGRNHELYGATNADLIAAARRIFVEKGYDGASTTEIVAAAGTSQGTMYYHFGDKRGLFIAVHDRIQQDLIARVEAAADAAAPDGWARFRATWRCYLTCCREAETRRVLLLDGPRVIGPEALRARDRTTAFAYFKETLTGMIADGVLAPADPHALAVLLFGALDQAAFEIADFPDDTALHDRLLAEVDRLMARLRA